ncbi:MAG: FAD:protein FMN transferase [Candidatus Limnocylindria bacterium]
MIAPSGRLRVEQIMGTAIGIDLRDAIVPEAAIDDAFASLRSADARFSTYRPESEVSRLGRGELTLDACSLELRRVLALAEQLRSDSGGHFDVGGHRAIGGLYPSGVVKGWAVEEAAWILDAAGARNYAINAGGDVLVRGEPAPGEPWRIGIRHPLRADAIAHVIELREGAVATSGAYERGEHITNPLTAVAPRDWLSLTVVGPSLTLADAYATAAFAMGRDGLAWVSTHAGYRAYGISADEVRWIDA